MIDKYSLFITKFKEIEILLPKIKNAPLDANMKWLEDNTSDLNIKNKL